MLELEGLSTFCEVSLLCLEAFPKIGLLLLRLQPNGQVVCRDGLGTLVSWQGKGLACL